MAAAGIINVTYCPVAHGLPNTYRVHYSDARASGPALIERLPELRFPVSKEPDLDCAHPETNRSHTCCAHR